MPLNIFDLIGPLLVAGFFGWCTYAGWRTHPVMAVICGVAGVLSVIHFFRVLMKLEP
jgi:hypothetical protein